MSQCFGNQDECKTEMSKVVKLKNRRVHMNYCSKHDQWNLLFKKLGEEDHEEKIVKTKLSLSHQAMCALLTIIADTSPSLLQNVLRAKIIKDEMEESCK